MRAWNWVYRSHGLTFQVCLVGWCHSRVKHQDWSRSWICICRSKKPSRVANTAQLSLIDQGTRASAMVQHSFLETQLRHSFRLVTFADQAGYRGTGRRWSIEWHQLLHHVHDEKAFEIKTLSDVSSLCGEIRPVSRHARFLGRFELMVSHCPWIWNCGKHYTYSGALRVLDIRADHQSDSAIIDISYCL